MSTSKVFYTEEALSSIQQEKSSKSEEKTNKSSKSKEKKKKSSKSKEESKNSSKSKEETVEEDEEPDISESIGEVEEDEEPDISDLFDDYAVFGDKSGDRGISFKNTYKWMTQAGVVGAQLQVTKADVKRCYYLIADDKERISCDELRIVIKTMAVDKLVRENDISDRMIAAGEPKVAGFADLFSNIFKPCMCK